MDGTSEAKVSPKISLEKLEAAKAELSASEAGLTSKEVLHRLKQYGPNSVEKKKKHKYPEVVQVLVKQLVPQVSARRDGAIVLVSVEDIVPGDVIRVCHSREVPADGILLPPPEAATEEETVSECLQVDMSMLTGESKPRRIDPGAEVYSSSHVIEGEGWVLVTATGAKTFLGAAAVLVEELAKPGQIATSQQCVEAVAGQAKVLVRDPTNDALKRVQVVVIEKTGSLTQNRLQVAGIWCGGSGAEVIVDAAAPQVEEKSLLRQLVAASTSCCSAQKSKRDVINSALVAWTESLKNSGADEGMPDVQQIFKGVQRYLAFTPQTKYSMAVCSSTAYHLDGGEGGAGNVVVFARGVVPGLLEHCSAIAIGKGDGGKIEQSLTEERKAEMTEAMDALVARGIRYLGVAVKVVGAEAGDLLMKREDLTMADAGDGWCFLGLVMLYDPPREGVTEAANKLAEMGIKLVIASGDARALTVEFATRVLGWKVEGGADKNNNETKESKEEKDQQGKGAVEIQGTDFGSDQFDWTILENRQGAVVSQCYPEHKYNIVKSLQRSGFVVAVGATGVNDVPAARAADASFALSEANPSVRQRVTYICMNPDNLGAIVETIAVVKQDTSPVVEKSSKGGKKEKCAIA